MHIYLGRHSSLTRERCLSGVAGWEMTIHLADVPSCADDTPTPLQIEKTSSFGKEFADSGVTECTLKNRKPLKRTGGQSSSFLFDCNFYRSCYINPIPHRERRRGQSTVKRHRSLLSSEADSTAIFSVREHISISFNRAPASRWKVVFPYDYTSSKYEYARAAGIFAEWSSLFSLYKRRLPDGAEAVRVVVCIVFWFALPSVCMWQYPGLIFFVSRLLHNTHLSTHMCTLRAQPYTYTHFHCRHLCEYGPTCNQWRDIWTPSDVVDENCFTLLFLLDLWGSLFLLSEC